MKVESDKQRDVVYFSFSTVDAARQVILGAGRIVDVAADETLVGVEFLSPSRGIDLSGVPRAVEIEREARRLGLIIRVPASAA